jgi:hypothetical protein
VKFSLIVVSVLLAGLSCWADTLAIDSGYFDSVGKVLYFSGDAAKGLWDQMSAITKEQVINSDALGWQKEDNGTHCELNSVRPRPFAHSVPSYTCRVSLANVGTGTHQ